MTKESRKQAHSMGTERWIPERRTMKDGGAMKQLAWRDAIIKVLPKDGEPMHYTEIAEAIVAAGLKTEVGATPAASVAGAISLSGSNEGEASPFVRVSRGYYALRQKQADAAPVAIPQAEDEDESGFVNAFGMFWRRDKVLWKSMPQLLGQQQAASQAVDFCQQKGVYLLHDGNKVIYVGRTTDQALGVRLKQHTYDRLNGRWDRFSWFGIFSVEENGSLSAAPPDVFNLENLIATMEALLIEGLEPPQNRRRGDDFSAVEFLQVEDPELEKSQILQLMDGLKKKL
jgi:hypothetical protein